MGIWKTLSGFITPTSKGQVKNKQRRVGQLLKRELRVEEKIGKLNKQLAEANKKVSGSGSKMERLKAENEQQKIKAKLAGEEHAAANLRMQEHAHAVQLMNGINSQIITLGKALDNFEATMFSQNDFNPLIQTMEVIHTKINPKKVLTDNQRIKNLLGLAIGVDEKTALEESGVKVKSIAAAEKMIKDDIRKFSDSAHVLSTAQQEMRKLKEKMEFVNKKYDLINGLIVEVLGELKILGHDFTGNIASSQKLGKEALASGLEFSPGLAKKV